MEKEHKVTITVQSESFGMVNQTITLAEYASTPEELVYKHQSISDALLVALNGDNSKDGVVRGMGEQFLDAMAENDGDLEEVLKNTPWGRGGKGNSSSKR